MKQLAQDKAEEFTSAVTSDSRWRLEDELMCQVFGFTLYGYVFGVGRVICFMDVQLDKGQALTIETFLTWQARWTTFVSLCVKGIFTDWNRPLRPGFEAERPLFEWIDAPIRRTTQELNLTFQTGHEI
jgi:hypothetical protein